MNQDVLVRNNVKVSGSGAPSILFAHGFGCDQNMWRFVAPAFENDYRVILFDYTGSGKSDLSYYNPEQYKNLEGYSEDVLEICDALELKDVIFVGHSVSGVIGALASIKRPELFETLVMVVPSPCYINQPPDYTGGFERRDIEELLALMDKNYLGWAGFLAPAVMKNPDRPELGQELEESFCSIDRSVAQQFAKATFFADNRMDLSNIKTPTLLIQTSDDAIAPRSVGEYMNREIPNSSLQMLDASGHCPHMSHPQETIDIIKNYLKTVK